VALADYLDSIAKPNLIAILKCTESILRENMQHNRICIPAIDATAGLFEENIFARIEDDYEYFPYEMCSDEFPSVISCHAENWIQVWECN
jgi:hypothetical protein